MFGLIVPFALQAQKGSVGIGVESPNPNAVLELVSPDANQGFMLPGLTTAQRQSIDFTSNLGSDENGLLVYDLDDNQFYYWLDTQWVPIASSELPVFELSNYQIQLGDQVIDLEFLADTIDNDATNELQQLTFDPSTFQLTIDQGNSVDLSSLAGSASEGSTTDELQDLVIEGSQLSLTGIDGGTVVELADIAEIDNQQLYFNSTTGKLFIDNGDSVDLSSLVVGLDGDATNELQSLSFDPATSELTIESGNTIDLSSILEDETNEIQDLELTGTELKITNNPSATAIDLSSLTGTDDQLLAFNQTLSQLSIESGNTIDLSSMLEDETNEIQDLELIGTDLKITNNASATTIDLSSLSGTDDQQLTFDEALSQLSIESGNTIDLSSLLEDDTNEIQDLQLDGSQLKITNNTSATTINLSSILEPDDQSLEFDPDNYLLSIQDGNSVDLSSMAPQTLSLTGTDLELSNGGGTVDLSSLTSTQWLEDGTSLYYSAGQVGVGVIPEKLLHIKQTSGPAILEIEGALNSAENGPAVRFTETFATDLGVEIYYDGSLNELAIRSVQDDVPSTTNMISFERSTSDVNIEADRFYIENKLITPVSTTIPINGSTSLTAAQVSGRVVNLTSTSGGSISTIAAGVDGQELMLIMTSTTSINIWSATSTTGTNKILVENGGIAMSRYDVLSLIYNSALQAWIQVSFSDNNFSAVID
ncbi:MAG: hypothetical protein CMB80_09760 [Flammeovirgaceae bacterium]|nr:hypothetical protein [Flammeovirgaceae bacterium]MBR08110.1 hypothetical protein [Rickettsiales bacterium]HCX21433.1 hypothetical protein [Cytophagales bacterium]